MGNALCGVSVGIEEVTTSVVRTGETVSPVVAVDSNAVVTVVEDEEVRDEVDRPVPSETVIPASVAVTRETEDVNDAYEVVVVAAKLVVLVRTV